jgi:TrpR family trp operon transcriptional repressor
MQQEKKKSGKRWLTNTNVLLYHYINMKRSKQEQGMQLFLELCKQKSSEDSLEELLTLLFTPEEQANINARMLIIKALIENQMPQRQLASHFNVSIGQITRGSNAIKAISDSFFKELKAFFSRQGGAGISSLIALLTCSWRLYS